MNRPQRADPCISNEPEIEVDAATSRILKERIKGADQGRVLPAKEARLRIQRWLSKSSTVKAHGPI